MDNIWLLLYLLIATASLVVSAVLTWSTWEGRRFVRRRCRRIGPTEPMGHVAVFAPCKGLDLGFEDNLRPLFEQDYGDYELIFIVEGSTDPAYETIQKLVAEYPDVTARIIVAGRATESGQKVHNLRVATADLRPEVEVLAFVDSDARPKRHWLSLLVARLGRDRVGAVTGYRWFVPQVSSLANHLICSINSTVAALFGNGGHHLVWGGSWAIRREVFESTGLHQAWYGTLSDDLVASDILHRARLRIEYEPRCLVPSPLDYSFQQTVEFLRRQYLIGRFYAGRLWMATLVVSTLSNVALWGGLILLSTCLFTKTSWSWVPAVGTLLLYGLNLLRAWLRQSIATECLPELKEKITAARRFDLFANPLVSFAGWLCLLASLFGNTIAWRGILYRIFPGGQIRMLNRQPGPLVTSADRRRRLRRRRAVADEANEACLLEDF